MSMLLLIQMIDQELSARAGSYESAFMWTAHHNTVILMSSLWSFLLPDALVMMILGMALYKLGVLQGQCAREVYAKMAVAGFAMGLRLMVSKFGSRFKASLT